MRGLRFPSKVFEHALAALSVGEPAQPADGSATGLGRGTKMTEKVCHECNGEGVVDQGTEDERLCPTCNGSGIVPDDGQGSEEVWNTYSERAMTANPQTGAGSPSSVGSSTSLNARR